MREWPAPPAGSEPVPFDVERTSVRVVLLDADGRVLLFRTIDASDPEVGTWWELPGGGMEPGESFAQTAVREVYEETGLVLSEGAVSDPTWVRSATYLRRSRRTLQHEVVVLARVPGDQPQVSGVGRTAEELADYVGHRWWAVDDVVASQERFFPGELPRLLPHFLTGQRIEEPFEWWN